MTAGLTPVQGEPVISLGTLTLVPYHTSLRHCSVCQSREVVLLVLLGTCVTSWKRAFKDFESRSKEDVSRLLLCKDSESNTVVVLW